MKFHENILNSFNVIEQTGPCHRNCYLQGSYKVQRGVTKKIHKQELWFLCFARRPNKLDIIMKFHEEILNYFQVREQTRFCDG